MPHITQPLARRTKRLARAIRHLYWPIAFVGALALTVLGAVVLIAVGQSMYMQAVALDITRATLAMEQARHAKLVDLCGGPEATPLPLPDGSIQCYDHRGRRTVKLRKEQVQ